MWMGNWYDIMLFRDTSADFVQTQLHFDECPQWIRVKVDAECTQFKAYLALRNQQLCACYQVPGSAARNTLLPSPDINPPRPQFIEHTNAAPQLAYSNLQPPPVLPRSPQRQVVVGFTSIPEDPEKLPSRVLSVASSNGSSNVSNPRSPVYSDKSSYYESNGGYSEALLPKNPTEVNLTRQSSVSTDGTGKKSRRLAFGPSLSLFRGSSEKFTKTPLPENMAFGFSSTGRSLCIWTKKNCDYFIKTDLPFREGKKYSLLSGRSTRVSGASVRHLAAADTAIAVLGNYPTEVTYYHYPIIITSPH